MSLQSAIERRIVYVIARKADHELIKENLKSFKDHPFVRDPDVRVVTFSEFEETRCFGEIRGTPIEDHYKRSRDSSKEPNWSIPDADANEQGIVLLDPSTKRSLLHEFGHCAVVKTKQGKNLRRFYFAEMPKLDRLMTDAKSRECAEQVILAPEDCWIERQITQFTASNGEALGQSAEQYLQNWYVRTSSTEGLDKLDDLDFSPLPNNRARAALTRLRFSLLCLCMSDIAKDYDTELAKYLDLSNRYAQSLPLLEVSFDDLWKCLREDSAEQWVIKSSQAAQRVFAKALRHST